jgi:hypothetical protein
VAFNRIGKPTDRLDLSPSGDLHEKGLQRVEPTVRDTIGFVGTAEEVERITSSDKTLLFYMTS